MLLRAQTHSLITSPPPTITREQARLLGTALRRRRAELSRGLMQNVTGWVKYDNIIQSHHDDLDPWIADEFDVYIDYLAQYFHDGDTNFKYLYISEKLKQFHDRSLTPDEDFENRRRVMEADLDMFREFAQSEVEHATVAALEALLEEIRTIVLRRGCKELAALMIGDCLHIYIRGFLTPLALEDNISLNPRFLATRNPVEQRKHLRELVDDGLNMIFFSPFTHQFSPEVSEFNG
jgi:hypothetical protein